MLVTGPAASTQRDVGEEARDLAAELVSVLAGVRALAVAQEPIPDAAGPLAVQLEGLSAKLEPRFAVSLLFYRAVCQYQLGDRDQVEALSARAQEAGVDEPDFVAMGLRGATPPGPARDAYYATQYELGKLLPFGDFNWLYDVTLSPPGFVFPIDPGPPFDPHIPVKVGLGAALADAGAAYENMGFLLRATDLYVAAIYTQSSWAWARWPEDAAALWLKVGNLEKMQGHDALAFRAYVGAAYLDGGVQAEAADGLAAVLAGPSGERPEPPAGTWTAEGARAVAEAYAKANLHPLAMAVLREAGEDLDADFGADLAQLRDEWGKRLDVIRRSRGSDCYVLRHQISAVEDWSQITLPWPSDTFWKPWDESEGRPHSRQQPAATQVPAPHDAREGIIQ